MTSTIASYPLSSVSSEGAEAPGTVSTAIRVPARARSIGSASCALSASSSTRPSPVTNVTPTARLFSANASPARSSGSKIASNVCGPALESSTGTLSTFVPASSSTTAEIPSDSGSRSSGVPLRSSVRRPRVGRVAMRTGLTSNSCPFRACVGTTTRSRITSPSNEYRSGRTSTGTFAAAAAWAAWSRLPIVSLPSVARAIRRAAPSGRSARASWSAEARSVPSAPPT